MPNDIEIQVIAIDAASNILGRIGQEFGALGQLAVGALTAAGSAMDFLIQKGIEEQDAVAKLNAMLAATGGVSGMTSQSLQDMAGSLAMVTRFSDDSIIAAETVLLRFKSLGSQYFPEATKAALNLATVMGVDASQAARQLGVALESPTTGLGLLRRAGIVFDEQTKKTIESLDKAGKTAEAQKLILDALTNTVGGVAEAMGKTFLGQWDIFNNNLDMAWQKMGSLLLDRLTPLETSFINLAESILPSVEKAFEDFLNASDKWMFIADLISNGINNVNWGDVSRQIAQGINSIDWNANALDFKAGADKIAKAIQTAMGQVDWGALFGSMTNAFAATVAGIEGFQWDWSKTKDQFSKLPQILSTPGGAGVLAQNLGQMQGGQIPGLPTPEQARQNGNEIINAISQVWSSITNLYTTGWANQLATVQNGAARIVSTIQSYAAQINNAILSWIPNIDTALRQIVNLFMSRGQNMIAKMIDGMNGMRSAITSAINNLMALIAGLIKSFSIPISLALPSLGPLESLIAQIAGLTTGGSHGYSNLGGGGGGKGGTVKARASGGVINEPVIGVGLRTGSAWSFAERGDEVVLPHGSRGSAPIIINLSINSMFSLADKSKAESELTPIILKAVRNARAANI